jgi:hypothetical protein
MQSGSELSKTVATFILQKILADDCGLNYICQTFDRFSHVAMVLGRMVLQQVFIKKQKKSLKLFFVYFFSKKKQVEDY